MKLNLNNALVIGTMSETVNDAGKHTFAGHWRPGEIGIGFFIAEVGADAGKDGGYLHDYSPALQLLPAENHCFYYFHCILR